MRGQQPMPLGSDVADFQLQVSSQLLFEVEIVLSGILSAHVRLEIAEEQHGLGMSPSLAPFRAG